MKRNELKELGGLGCMFTLPFLLVIGANIILWTGVAFGILWVLRHFGVI